MDEDTDLEALLAEINDLRRQKLNKPQRRHMVAALREAGWTYQRIAEEVGASLGTVHADGTRLSILKIKPRLRQSR